MTDAERNLRFKVIPALVEANAVLRYSVGRKPAIMGKKIVQQYYHGEGYMEMAIDLGSSKIAATLTYLCASYSKRMVIDLGFVVQGDSEQELPERLFGSIRMCRINLDVAEPLLPC